MAHVPSSHKAVPISRHCRVAPPLAAPAFAWLWDRGSTIGSRPRPAPRHLPKPTPRRWDFAAEAAASACAKRAHMILILYLLYYFSRATIANACRKNPHKKRRSDKPKTGERIAKVIARAGICEHSLTTLTDFTRCLAIIPPLYQKLSINCSLKPRLSLHPSFCLKPTITFPSTQAPGRRVRHSLPYHKAADLDASIRPLEEA